MQTDVKEGLVSVLIPIREGVKHLPQAVTFPQFQSITAYDDDGEEEWEAVIGDIAEQYLRKFASVSGTDKIFGVRDKDGKFYIGNNEAKVKENNIIVGDRDYLDTHGLWKLIVATTSDDKIVTNGDYNNYAELLHSRNALRRNNDDSETNGRPTKAGNGSTY